MPGFASSISESLRFAIQLPELASVEETFFSPEEIAETVRPILRDRMALTNYDRIFPVLQFLEHYKKLAGALSPIEAFKTFTFYPLLPSNRGGPCVSLTLDLYYSLPKKLKPYIALAQLPSRFQQFAFPQYCHTAVLIKYRSQNDQGFVLLDPSFDIDEPIILKKNGDAYFYDTKLKGIWKFFLENDRIICETSKNRDDPTTKMVYLTDQVLNPIGCSAMPMILSDRRLSLLSRREDGSHLAHLNIELDKRRVIWDQNGTQFDPISFEDIEKGWKFPNWFADALFLTQEELTEKILIIIKNKSILNDLYYEYMTLLKETQDFSITGKLDLRSIESRMKADKKESLEYNI